MGPGIIALTFEKGLRTYWVILIAPVKGDKRD
jgi:hypothetical protein